MTGSLLGFGICFHSIGDLDLQVARSTVFMKVCVLALAFLKMIISNYTGPGWVLNLGGSLWFGCVCECMHV